MATTRGKGTTGTRAPADPAAEAAPRARRTRTRAPEDEISGTAAPTAAASPAPAGAATARGRRPAAAPAAETPSAPAAPKPRGGRKKRETYTETAARRRREKEVDQLKADLRAFASARPSGWNHDDWVAFLAHLAERGHDTSNHDDIGARLERERLSVVLEGINGLGPKRVNALVDRFHTLWSMRHAHPTEIAAVSGMTRPLAERVAQELLARYP
ncbi:MAG TPA: helix-hairpin-helix domain-containing protein [Longimicrobium sp.]|nr:helix-hairpin-helix domain-containing protein [Longimicrobium sp.]